jgi:MoaA/NifB/PqqE/SkfB family radical SAM enzyme
MSGLLEGEREMDKWYAMDSQKHLWHQDRLQDFLDGKRIMPITLDIGIHKACNIKCVYCYGVKQVKSAEYIKSDRLLMLAEDAAKAGIKSVAIIGDGEPTMNRGLYDFVTELNIQGVDCAVATNGLLLNNIKTLVLTTSCKWLRFNISGVEKYDRIMGAPKGSLEKFESVVRFAVEHKHNCTIGLQTVLIPDGFTEIIPLAKKAIEWGVDYLVIKQFSDGGEGMPIHFDMDSYDRAVGNLKIAELMSNKKTKIIVKWSAMQDSRNITKEKKWDFDRCIDLPFIFQISGDGGCYPCGFMFGNKEYCYGNVNKERLIDILNSDRYWSIVKKAAETPLEKLCAGQCRHCESLKFMDKLKKAYSGNLKEALVKIVGGIDKYNEMINNPPEHINFL